AVGLDRLVLVDHGDGDLVKPAVRIPVRPEVQRAVHQRHQDQEHQGDLGQGALEPTELEGGKPRGGHHLWSSGWWSSMAGTVSGSGERSVVETTIAGPEAASFVSAT